MFDCCIHLERQPSKSVTEDQIILKAGKGWQMFANILGRFSSPRHLLHTSCQDVFQHFPISWHLISRHGPELCCCPLLLVEQSLGGNYPLHYTSLHCITLYFTEIALPGKDSFIKSLICHHQSCPFQRNIKSNQKSLKSIIL